MVQTGKPAYIPGPDFKFEEENVQDAPKTVRAIAGADLYVVNYTEADGSEQNRLIAVVNGKQGGHKVFIFQEKIQNVRVVTPSKQWFEEAVSEILKSGDSEEGVGSV